MFRVNILYSGGAYSLKEIREGLLCNYFWDGKGLIGILENIRATLKLGRGLSGIIFIWCRGYFLNRETWRVYLEKGHKRGRVLKRIERKGGA